MTTSPRNPNPALSVYRWSLETPDRLALHVAGADYTYRQLVKHATGIAEWLGPARRVGILGSRSLAACAGVLGAMWNGAAYVPLNPANPEDRLARIFETVGLDAVVADEAGISALSPRLREMCHGKVFAPFAVTPERILSGQGPVRAPEECESSDVAYIIFTSGSTGTPKGVMISFGSLRFLLDAVQERFQFNSDDRFSQAAELTFDVSVFDLFAAWGLGASVHVVPAHELMAPSRFIRRRGLSVWSSVPSIPTIMRRMNMLRANAFPTLRYSLFAGEPLPIDLARAWQIAAPHSQVENLYGPTEATIVCIGSCYHDGITPTPDRGTVPIGLPFPGTKAAVLDCNLNPLPRGNNGQLALSGPNLALGYLEDPALTAARFVTISGESWYLTGDFARQDPSGIFHHLGRVDNQVKVLGNRVELEEVETHLRAAAGVDEVAAVAWPIHDGSAEGIIAFVVGASLDPEEIRARMSSRVPAYMLPRRTIQLKSLPLNASGKVDRSALLRYLEQ